MTITIPYEIGDKITSENGREAVLRSVHVYVDANGDVQNIRAYTRECGYVTLERKTKKCLTTNI